MVRPHFGPPRFKSRPYGDGPRFVPHEEQYNSHFKNRRDAQDYPGKSPNIWRGNRGRGRTFFNKRVPFMGDRREPPYNQWRSQNQDSFESYSHQMEPHHSHRRPSPPRPNRHPKFQHRSSSHSPMQGSPGRRGAPFGGHPSAHRSPSPRHYHKSPNDRRPSPTPPYRGSFRGPKRQPGFSHEEQRIQGPPKHYSPRNRQFDHSTRGAKRWNVPGEFSHQHTGEYRPPGSQRKPRGFRGRSSYQERWSGEQDSRRQRGDMEREGNRSHSLEMAQESPSHLPPFRSPSWKEGPPSSFRDSPRERQMAVGRKRRMPDVGLSYAGAEEEHGPQKFPRRDRPPLLNVPMGFGGRPLSLRDKSRIVKGRQMRTVAAIGPRAPLKPKPQMGLSTSDEDMSSVLSLRKKRFQPHAAPLRKVELRRTNPHQSSPSTDDESSKSSGESDTVTEKVESHRSLRTRSSSPIDKHLTSDLVVVSHWQAGPSSSYKDCLSPRNQSPKSKNEQTCDSDDASDDEAPQPHGFRPAPNNHRDGYSHKTFRPFRPVESHRHGRPFLRSRPGPPQRLHFNQGPRRPFPEPHGNFRKPLMESFVPRPFPQQKPVFRKSQSIMSKYRNMQVMRQQRVPYNNRGPHQQRW